MFSGATCTNKWNLSCLCFILCVYALLFCTACKCWLISVVVLYVGCSQTFANGGSTFELYLPAALHWFSYRVGEGGAVSSPSGVRVKAPVANAFLCSSSSKVASGGHLYFGYFMQWFLFLADGGSSNLPGSLATGLVKCVHIVTLLCFAGLQACLPFAARDHVLFAVL